MSKTSDKAKLAMIQSFADYLDNGSQSATVIFYGGVQPTNTETVVDSGNALVSLIFPEPCFKESTASYIELHPTGAATVTKAGTATWARIYNGAGEVAADLTVGSDIVLANADLVVGGTLSIASIKLRP